MVVGLTSILKHRIQLNECEPFKQRFRKIHHSMFAEVQKHIQQLLDANIIHHSQSPWASNEVQLRKKDSSLHKCTVYQQLNLHTVKDRVCMFLPWMVITTVKTGFFLVMEEMLSSFPFWKEMDETRKWYKIITQIYLSCYSYTCTL
ncbi:hypothetical protein LSH36_1057g00025 [Paralvinella palmiformis]|uniref:Uncharacterized protein n=1 Tax=Paralvinella palmiformis TaxID=53620 RepID=A0AAD9MST0_9ANNE|nr:hypothetical protein LSH36_1057g00025 [Paralvinella palmiformis]